MLKLENPKLQHFPGNVEDVEDVEVAGETWTPPLQKFPLQLQHLQHLQHFPGNVEVFFFLQLQHLQHFPSFKHIFHQKVLKTGEMLKIVPS